MKNLTNKQKIIAVVMLVVLFCIGFLLGIFTGIGRKNGEDKEFQNSLQSNIQKGDTFYATIEEIYGEGTHILVKGLEINDINYRGEFRFSIDNNTELIWRGTKIDISSLKVGQNISVTHTGGVLEIYPAQLTKVTKIAVLEDKIEENINNKVTTIDIQVAFGEESENKSITLNQEEIYEIFDIIDNLKFKQETCDGLPSYYIKYNSEEKDNFVTYGLEIFYSQYHITSSEKGEAILSQEQKEKIDKILLKFNKDVSKKEYQTMAQEIENSVQEEFDKAVINQQRNKE